MKIHFCFANGLVSVHEPMYLAFYLICRRDSRLAGTDKLTGDMMGVVKRSTLIGCVWI